MENCELSLGTVFPKTAQKGRLAQNLINQELFEGRLQSNPSKKVCNKLENIPEEKLEFLVQSNNPYNASSFQDTLEGSTKDLTPAEIQSIFDSLEMRYELKYEKAISVEVSVKEVPKIVDCIEYGEAKNYLKTLGGYFLKTLAPKMPPGRSFGDKDCLISLKIWNALFITEERKRINVKTKKVKVFIQEIEFLNERITPRDWMTHFIKFMLTVDVNEFQKKGHIKEPKRILLYKMLTVLLKATAQLFNQIYSDIRTSNINITWFKITEIYKAKVAFSFKTDFYLGDKKLIEPLRSGISTRKNFIGLEEIRNSSKQPSKGDDSAMAEEDKGKSKLQNLTTKSTSSFKSNQATGMSGNLESSSFEMRKADQLKLAKHRIPKKSDKPSWHDDLVYLDPGTIPLPLAPYQFEEIFTNFLIRSGIVTDSPRTDFLRISKLHSENALLECKVEE